MFKWKNKDDNGKWRHSRKTIKAESEVEAWVFFFIWAAGMDAEDFLLMKYNCQNIKDTIKYLTLEEIEKVFNNFIALGMIPELEKLNMKQVT
jgi:hypothetical protein